MSIQRQPSAELAELELFNEIGEGGREQRFAEVAPLSNHLALAYP
jgi:hypothetical protein